MTAIVKRITREIECLDGDELRAVIDALVEIFERRQVERLSRSQAPARPSTPAV